MRRFIFAAAVMLALPAMAEEPAVNPATKEFAIKLTGAQLDVIVVALNKTNASLLTYEQIAPVISTIIAQYNEQVKPKEPEKGGDSNGGASNTDGPTADDPAAK